MKYILAFLTLTLSLPCLAQSTGYIPVVHPSSGNLVGSGCVTAHQSSVADQNLCANADVWNFVSNDPSAVTVLTVGGSCTAGDIVTLNFFYGTKTASASYTVPSTGSGSACTNGIVNGFMSALQANSNLFNNAQVPGYIGTIYKGGYSSSTTSNTHTWQLSYVVPISSTQFAFDWDTTAPMAGGTFPMQMSYSVTGSATETITFPAGNFYGATFGGGTSTGSANTQAVSASGYSGIVGSGVSFTAGFTNTGAITLNVNGIGAVSIKTYQNGSLADLASNTIQSGIPYLVLLDPSGVFVLGRPSVILPGGSTAGTRYQLPNSLDNNPVIVTGRGPTSPFNAPAIGSVIFALYGTGATTADPSTRNVNYGSISDLIVNTIPGLLQSAWLIQPQGGTGIYFQQGIYANLGCAFPFAENTGCYVDPGTGGINMTSYWLGKTVDGAGAVLAVGGSTVSLNTLTTNWPINLSTGGGVTVGSPTGGAKGSQTLNVQGAYYQNGTVGVTCSGSPTSSFASSLGIVTHC